MKKLQSQIPKNSLKHKFLVFRKLSDVVKKVAQKFALVITVEVPLM